MEAGDGDYGEGKVFKSTGKGHSDPPQGSETLWSLNLHLGTKDKELGGKLRGQ